MLRLICCLCHLFACLINVNYQKFYTMTIVTLQFFKLKPPGEKHGQFIFSLYQ